MRLAPGIAIAGVLAVPLAFASPSSAQVACAGGDIAQFVGYGSTGCVSGDKIYSNFSFTGFNTSTALSITNNGAEHVLSASGLNFNGPASASYSYSVAIASGNPLSSFKAYRTNGSTSSITIPLIGSKTLTGTPAGGVSTSTDAVIGNIVWYTPTIAGPISFSGGISVTSGRMDTFSDTLVQEVITPVPGPLPILGAAFAFRSARKLRSTSARAKQG
jgi:hypothetical protein